MTGDNIAKGNHKLQLLILQTSTARNVNALFILKLLNQLYQVHISIQSIKIWTKYIQSNKVYKWLHSIQSIQSIQSKQSIQSIQSIQNIQSVQSVQSFLSIQRSIQSI